MRRWAASLLLLLTLLLPMQPLVASAQQQSSVPACCRRNGAHHCMMSMGYERMLVAASEASFAPAPCRWWKLTTASPVAVTAISAFQFTSDLASTGTVAFAGVPFVRLNRGQRKSARAPPAFIL